MEQREPDIQAFCTPTLALAQAKALDARRAPGETLGALAGVPLAVRDLICTAGVRTTSGSAAYKDFIPDEVTVERLLAADAILLGKTTEPEFGYSGFGHNPLFPSPRNPWDLTMTPGGSSAGSGAAVAARLCPVALGSDGGGSVHIPAAHYGIYGFKASMGRVPLWPGCRDKRYPGVSSWESLEHIGLMTCTVRDTALMVSLMAGPDMRDRHSIPCNDFDWLGAPQQPVEKLRIAFSADFGYVAVYPEVRALVTAVVQRFAAETGAELELADPGFSDLSGMRRLMAEQGDQMSPHLIAMLQRDWRAETFTDAIATRKAVRQ